MTTWRVKYVYLDAEKNKISGTITAIKKGRNALSEIINSLEKCGRNFRILRAEKC